MKAERRQVKKDFGRVAPRTWDRLRPLGDDAAIVHAYLATGPIERRPSGAGIAVISDLILADGLGDAWTLDRVAAAREKLTEAGLVEYDAGTRTWLLVDGYWRADNPSWFKGRLRQLGNLPA